MNKRILASIGVISLALLLTWGSSTYAQARWTGADGQPNRMMGNWNGQNRGPNQMGGGMMGNGMALRSMFGNWGGLTKADSRATTFPGYYTLDTLTDGKVIGMLSVNAYSGQVFLHTWHGDFVEMVGEDH